jgi:hypothetical protein
MSMQWNLDHVLNFKALLTPAGTPVPSTEALIRASYSIFLPVLDEPSLPEWLYRLSCLQDCNHYFLFGPTPEGPVPIRIDHHDLRRHLGLVTTANYSSPEDFDRLHRILRMSQIRESLPPE